MFPELFHIGGLTVYSYGFFILIGVIFAYFFVKKNAKEYGLNSEKISELFLWCIAGVFIGGKLFFFFEKPVYYAGHFDEFLSNLGSGFVFYGSFITTIPILIWWFRKNKLPVWDMFDLVGVGGAFVHAFGKIGCFMAGCCHGKVCNNGWGVTFTNPGSHAEPLNTPLYPVQLWDSLIIFAAIAIMIFIKKRKAFSGQLFLIYGIWYSIGRFVTEYFRGDEERGYLFGGALSHSQFIAILVFITAAGMYFWRYKNRNKFQPVK